MQAWLQTIVISDYETTQVNKHQWAIFVFHPNWAWNRLSIKDPYLYSILAFLSLKY